MLHGRFDVGHETAASWGGGFGDDEYSLRYEPTVHRLVGQVSVDATDNPTLWLPLGLALNVPSQKPPVFG